MRGGGGLCVCFGGGHAKNMASKRGPAMKNIACKVVGGGGGGGAGSPKIITVECCNEMTQTHQLFGCKLY